MKVDIRVFYSFAAVFPLIAITILLVDVLNEDLVNAYCVILGVVAILLFKSTEVLFVYSVTFGALFLAPYVVTLLLVQEMHVQFIHVPLLSIMFYVVDLVWRDKLFFFPDKSFALRDFLVCCAFIFFVFIFPIFFFVAVGFIGSFIYRSKDRRSEGIFAFFLIMVFTVYLISWDGFGRTNIVALCLFLILILMNKRGLFLNKSKAFLIMLIAAVLVPIGSIVRYGFEYTLGEGISIIFEDSAFHHLLITTEILDQAPSLKLVEAFQQFLLFFLSWIPREVWGLVSGFEKPFGLGYSYVDAALDRSAGENFSVSLGFFGEFIYLYGIWLWIFPYLMFIAFIFIFLKFLIRYDRTSMVALYLTAFLITYVWGGGASFGSRVWWFCMPFLIFTSLSKVRLKNSL